MRAQPIIKGLMKGQKVVLTAYDIKNKYQLEPIKHEGEIELTGVYKIYLRKNDGSLLALRKCLITDLEFV